MKHPVISLLACVSLAQAAQAQDSVDTPHPDSLDFKLTAGFYQFGDDHGKDLNLRWQHDDTHVWIGHYEDHSMGAQDRIGADSSLDLNELVSIQPSLQAATGGFVGGSLNTQIGHSWYGLAGWGRTNLKPYVNLNFDPNDAVTLGGGHLFDNGQNWMLFVVKDDRLHTGQTDWHLTARIPVADERLSLDAMPNRIFLPTMPGGSLPDCGSDGGSRSCCARSPHARPVPGEHARPSGCCHG
jgi:hypothetical protein